jgi:hypothetical protein
MKNIIKFLLNPILGRYLKRRGEERQIKEWIDKGRPLPPVHAFKRSIIRKFKQKYRLYTLIETGTYKGEMVEAMLPVFRQIHSVELHSALFASAKDKFKKHSHVTMWQGDSAIVLEDILKQLQEPALFWLDGHYSGVGTARGNNDTPVIKEIAGIGAHPLNSKHVVLIDDAHCFNGSNGYPTLRAMEKMAAEMFPKHHFKIQDNIVEIVPVNNP